MARMVNGFDLLGEESDNEVKELIGVVDERAEAAYLALVQKNKEEEKRKMKEEEEREKEEEKKRKETMIRSLFYGRQGGGPANNKPSARSVSRSVSSTTSERSYHSPPRSTNFVHQNHGRVNDGYEIETNQPHQQGLGSGKETKEVAQAFVESQQDVEQGNNQLQSNGVNENQGGGDGERPRRPNVNGSSRRKQKKNKMNASSEDKKSQGNNNGNAASDTSSTVISSVPAQEKSSFAYTCTLQEYERNVLANKKKPLEAASTNKSDVHETKSLEKKFESMQITEKKDNNIISVHQPHQSAHQLHKKNDMKVKGPHAKTNNTINIFHKPRKDYRPRPRWEDYKSDDKSEADPSQQAAVAKPVPFTLNIAEFPSLGRA